MGPSDSITVAHGYRAMFHFLESYWEARGKSDEDIAILLGSMNYGDKDVPNPLDQAMWTDWLDSIWNVR